MAALAGRVLLLDCERMTIGMNRARVPTWRERFAALRHVPEMLYLVWQAHRGFTALTLVLRLVRASIPVSILWVARLIIDAVVAATRGPAHWPYLWLLVALEFALALTSDLLSRCSQFVEGMLADLFTYRLSMRIMEHAACLDLAQFEDPAFQDQLERARRTSVRVGLLMQLFQVAQGMVTLLSLSAGILAWSPAVFLIMVLAIAPSFVGESHFAGLQYMLARTHTAERRELDYLALVATNAVAAKEVRIIALGPWLVERYRRVSSQLYLETRGLAARRMWASVLLGIASLAGYYGAYAFIVSQAARGAITIGMLSFLVGACSRGRDQIQQLLLGLSGLAEQTLYLRDLFEFLRRAPTITSRPDAIRVPREAALTFAFENVGFAYPGAERWAIRHVDVTLHADSRIAIVGENGAGKSTIVKLLTRLYEPTEGRILLNGRDLRLYDLDSLRRAVAVVFQDFARYDLRLDENIGIGDIQAVAAYFERAGECGIDSPPAGLVRAAERSLAASIATAAPNGYRQMLGRRFDGGIDLSGGEWQKVALARAHFRDAQVICLDEPTAALDARAENELYLRFDDLTKNRLGILISHRLSAARMADRVLVMREGRIVEDGPHASLLAHGGLYRDLFTLQASAYA